MLLLNKIYYSHWFLYLKSIFVAFLEKITFIAINCFDYFQLSLFWSLFWLLWALAEFICQERWLFKLDSWSFNPSFVVSDPIWQFKSTLSIYRSLQVKRSFFAYLRLNWQNLKIEKTLIWYNRSNWEAG